MADTVVNGVSALEAGQDPSATGRTPEQLRTLAAQFESLLIGQMLRDMRRSMFDDDEEGKAGLGGGPLADALFSELSVALSRAGGFGLGASLAGPLAREAGVEAPAVLADPLALPEIVATAEPSPATSIPDRVAVAMPGRLSSAYGWRRDPIDGAVKFHKGVDIAMPVGQDLPAARSGRVEFAGEVAGYGLTVVVRHSASLATRYAHLSEILVSPGDEVAAGQTLGRSGATGRTTGPHLHFEVLEDGAAVDPTALFN